MIRELTFLGLTVATYTLMAIIAAITGAAMSWRPLRKTGLSAAGTILLLSVICIAFLAGARIWNVAANPDSYGPDRPWYTLQMNGLSMFGGILGSITAVSLFSAIKRISLVKLLDIFTIPAAVSFCIARIGCFMNGCCSGKRTDVPWGIIFPSGSDITLLHRHAVHPTQIYELLLALIGIPLCLWLVKLFRAGEGGRFFIYGVWFCTMRMIVHPFRLFPYSYTVTTYIYPLIYYVLIVIGIFLFVFSCRQSRCK
ncbi:MAG: prolipoprotein diacylglyceryl transferase [Clostridiales bacterium]|nr:prolipoprotein diacylglyceryl transferase [Clostridiales bacterium]